MSVLAVPKVRWAAAVAACALVAPFAVSSGLSPAEAGGVGSPGAPGIGDAYFPNYGNGGYDVGHYDIHVRYGVGSEKLRGDTSLTATATQDLSSFNLDLRLRASKVWVNGDVASFTQSKHELVVTPATGLTNGAAFDVRVRYAGVPGQVRSPGIGAWFETPDGAIAAGEPEVAPLWYPSNDHPSDKATFDIFVQTRKGTQVISNGLLQGRKPVGKDVRWHWKMRTPMATYLATAVIGDYEIDRGTTPGGVPYIYGITEHMKGALDRNARRSLRITPRVVDFFTSKFGFYPFDNTGGTLANASFGFSLENQTRPNYSKVFFSGGVNHEVIAHELAHMWWGDTVSVERWQHIWLNEGFATWSSWFYLVNEPGADLTLNDVFRANYRQLRQFPDFWKLPISDPGRQRLFDYAVYGRGALALQALRNVIGSADHYQLMRQWAADHRDGNGTVPEFEALAESISGQDLTRFFDEWLDQPNRPKPSADLGFPDSMLKSGSTAPLRRVPDSMLIASHRGQRY
ncbi:MAG: M1 family metallopeptidase [Nocardioidaceae bacterium]